MMQWSMMHKLVVVVGLLLVSGVSKADGPGEGEPPSEPQVADRTTRADSAGASPSQEGCSAGASPSRWVGGIHERNGGGKRGTAEAARLVGGIHERNGRAERFAQKCRVL